MADKYLVPRRLDDPELIGFWTIDEFAGILIPFAWGILAQHIFIGIGLAAGAALPQVLAELGHVAEGVYSAATVVARARSLGVEMPISEAVVEVLEGRIAPQQALWQLMSRQPRPETQRVQPPPP